MRGDGLPPPAPRKRAATRGGGRDDDPSDIEAMLVSVRAPRDGFGGGVCKRSVRGVRNENGRVWCDPSWRTFPACNPTEPRAGSGRTKVPCSHGILSQLTKFTRPDNLDSNCESTPTRTGMRSLDIAN